MNHSEQHRKLEEDFEALKFNSNQLMGKRREINLTTIDRAPKVGNYQKGYTDQIHQTLNCAKLMHDLGERIQSQVPTTLIDNLLSQEDVNSLIGILQRMNVEFTKILDR